MKDDNKTVTYYCKNCEKDISQDECKIVEKTANLFVAMMTTKEYRCPFCGELLHKEDADFDF